jgi:hypothetical protein
MQDPAIRWFESRTLGDLEGILEGLAFPVVLIDLNKQPLLGLEALDLVRTRTPGGRSLVLDPEGTTESRILSRELGATHVCSGFAPPPFVAGLFSRWIAMARQAIESAGWSRITFPKTATDPWSWLSEYLGEPAAMNEVSPDPRQWAPPIPVR